MGGTVTQSQTQARGTSPAHPGRAHATPATGHDLLLTAY